MSGITLARPLQLDDKPVTRVENYCATGSEALRQAAYAVASGAYDMAMAVGVEKVKDSGYQGLNAFPIPNDGTAPHADRGGDVLDGRAGVRQARTASTEDELRTVLARIASKNHYNGARNPRAQFRKEMSVEKICAMPAVAGSLSVFDCAGVADGSAAAIVVPGRGRAPATPTTPLYHQGAVVRRRQRQRPHRPELRLHDLPRGRADGQGRVRAGRHHRPAHRAGDGRGARLLHPDRAGADGGPRLLRSAARRGRRSSPAPSTSTATCRSTPTAASRASATRSARPACG